jgi:hypothetical protein
MGLPAWRAGGGAVDSRLTTLDAVFSELSLIHDLTHLSRTLSYEGGNCSVYAQYRRRIRRV